MFISKKRYLEEIAKAKQETADKICAERNLDDRFGYVHRDMQDLHRRVYELEKRLNADKSETTTRPINY